MVRIPSIGISPTRQNICGWLVLTKDNTTHPEEDNNEKTVTLADRAAVFDSAAAPGGDPKEDIQRLENIAGTVDARLRIDANQGWNAKQAVTVGRELARLGIDLDLLEQPVSAGDYHGLRWVRQRLDCPVYADESVFSAKDALRLVKMAAVDQPL